MRSRAFSGRALLAPMIASTVIASTVIAAPRIATTVIVATVLTALTGLSGCGNSDEAPRNQNRESRRSLERQPHLPEEAAPDPGELPPDDPAHHAALGFENPVNTVERVLVALQDGQLEVVYSFLPGGYQAQVDDLIRQFAARMDPEIWNETIAVLRKAVQVLKSQKALFIELAVQPGQKPQDLPLSQKWGELTAALESLVNSDALSLDGLRTIRVRAFLRHHLNPVFAPLKELAVAGDSTAWQQLSRAKVTLVEKNEGVAILRFQFAGEQTPTESEFVLMDGGWFPLQLARGWEEAVAKIRENLENLTPDTQETRKPGLLKNLEAMNSDLDQMLAASSTTELIAAGLALQIHLLELVRLLGTQSGPAGGVMLFIDRELSDAEQTELLIKLEALTDRPDEATYTITAGGGETVLSLKPVKDPAAFAEKLTFARTNSIEPGTRVLRVTLPEASAPE